MFSNIYQNEKVLVTGHTGFKGVWLTRWLELLGSKITGFSREIPTEPNHFSLLNQTFPTIWGDITDRVLLQETIQSIQPTIIFHLAAQPMVKESYLTPVETVETNVMGTIHLLEAVRFCTSVKAVVIVTSDKCYENSELETPFSENAPLGGYDLYSASKGMAELAVAAYRSSFFNPMQFGKNHETLIATVRAGNVIGGGDWGAHRIVPDTMVAASLGKSVIIRSPEAIRPWQHVLEPLSGYLKVGEELLKGNSTVASAWNFGPQESGHRRVLDIVQNLNSHWEKVCYEVDRSTAHVHEASVLKLDCSKAHNELFWKPVWDFHSSLKYTTDWYRLFYEENSTLTDVHISLYINDATEKGLSWVS